MENVSVVNILQFCRWRRFRGSARTLHWNLCVCTSFLSWVYNSLDSLIHVQQTDHSTSCGMLKVKVLFIQLCLTLWDDCQAPLSMGLFRQEYWTGLPFPSPEESSWSRDWTQVSHIAGRLLTYHQGSPKWYVNITVILLVFFFFFFQLGYSYLTMLC